MWSKWWPIVARYVIIDSHSGGRRLLECWSTMIKVMIGDDQSGDKSGGHK